MKFVYQVTLLICFFSNNISMIASAGSTLESQESHEKHQDYLEKLQSLTEQLTLYSDIAIEIEEEEVEDRLTLQQIEEAAADELAYQAVMQLVKDVMDSCIQS